MLPTIFDVAADIQRMFVRRDWRYCFIGGLALQRWGENRVTQDVDVSLFTGFENEEAVVDALLAEYPARIPDARQFALSNRVLLLTSSSNIGIDISLAGMPFENDVIVRSTVHEFSPEAVLRTCSAEDLIILKCFAARPKDWSDVRGILIRQRKTLDMHLISTELAPLAELKEEPQILQQLDELLNDLHFNG